MRVECYIGLVVFVLAVSIIVIGCGYLVVNSKSIMCERNFSGYAIQQCKERVRLGEPVFNEVRE